MVAKETMALFSAALTRPSTLSATHTPSVRVRLTVSVSLTRGPLSTNWYNSPETDASGASACRELSLKRSIRLAYYSGTML